jgi:hypothetical protein
MSPQTQMLSVNSPIVLRMNNLEKPPTLASGLCKDALKMTLQRATKRAAKVLRIVLLALAEGASTLQAFILQAGILSSVDGSTSRRATLLYSRLKKHHHPPFC